MYLGAPSGLLLLILGGIGGMYGTVKFIGAVQGKKGN